jgi:hypothetical protein
MIVAPVCFSLDNAGLHSRIFDRNFILVVGSLRLYDIHNTKWIN